MPVQLPWHVSDLEEIGRKAVLWGIILLVETTCNGYPGCMYMMK